MEMWRRLCHGTIVRGYISVPWHTSSAGIMDNRHNTVQYKV